VKKYPKWKKKLLPTQWKDRCVHGLHLLISPVWHCR
jgi:hypothetical protein